MTRAERIGKLGRAIRVFRGRYDETSGKWLAAPQPARAADVMRHLDGLRLNVAQSMAQIRGFKHVNEFREWIKAI